MNQLQIVIKTQFAANTSTNPLWGLACLAPASTTGKLESRNAGKRLVSCQDSALPGGVVVSSGMRNAHKNMDFFNVISGFPVCRLQSGEIKRYFSADFLSGGAYEF
jgi:hypothetical protein